MTSFSVPTTGNNVYVKFYTVSQKTCHSSLKNYLNGKCWPILKILSLLDSAIELQLDPVYVAHYTVLNTL